MNFGVGNFIQNLKPQIYQKSYPNFSSEPTIDLYSPGLLLKLYSEVVPLANHTPKVSSKLSTDNETILSEQNEQEGSGMDEKIKNSFLHPRPIKTETIKLIKNKSGKRKSVGLDNSTAKVPKVVVKHKFNLV